MGAPELNLAALAKYSNDFLREVEERVEEGEWVKMCMQCGVCAGSCPFGPYWEHSPQKIFMMIRAGKRDEVLRSDSMWMCTSCYNCVVRCPRKLPITQIMHGLATYAERLRLAPKMQPTRRFSLAFWDNCTRTGRVNELKLVLQVYFRNGFVAGLKEFWNMRFVGLKLLLARRMNPFELFLPHRCKGARDIHAMLAMAYEIENRKRGFAK
jgi:quinone-modifying oxidoreductase subunit QmoC